MSFQSIYKSLNKKSAAMLTPEAQQAALEPPPQDPSMMGAPAGVPPMDPAMAGGMPPAGAPVDPSMGMPPQGAAPMGQPGAWMQDQVFMQFLQQMGVQVQPDGTAIDPNGQPVPPEMMDQIYAQFQQEMAAAQGGAPGGAPVDPAAMGGMPPEGMPPEGAPGEMPPEAPMEMPEETLNQIAGVVQQVVDATVEEKIAALDKKLTAFTDKIDAIKMLLDDILVDNAKADKSEAEEGAALDAELEKDLSSARGGEDVQLQPTEQMLGGTEAVPAQGVPNMLDIMRGNA